MTKKTTKRLTKKEQDFYDLCESMYQSNREELKNIKSVVLDLFFDENLREEDNIWLLKELVSGALESIESIDSFSSMPFLNFKKAIGKKKEEED